MHSDPEILGGTPVFVGTRVPFQILLDYLEGGETLDEFLENFPTVTREQAIAAALEQAKEGYLPMRLLLDECVPRKLRSDLQGHDVRTVQGTSFRGSGRGSHQMNWKDAPDSSLD